MLGLWQLSRDLPLFNFSVEAHLQSLTTCTCIVSLKITTTTLFIFALLLVFIIPYQMVPMYRQYAMSIPNTDYAPLFRVVVSYPCNFSYILATGH
jgi:hypothetical protein